MRLCCNKLNNLIWIDSSSIHPSPSNSLSFILRRRLHHCIRLFSRAASAFLTLLLLLLLPLLLLLLSAALLHSSYSSDRIITQAKLVPQVSINFARREEVQEADRPRLDLIDRSMECERSHPRTDVCVVRGDVRVVGRGGAGQRPRQKHLPNNYTVLQVVDLGRPSSSSSSAAAAAAAESGVYAESREERIRPYTRKWEENVMKTIDEVTIKRQVIRMGKNLTEKEMDMEMCHVRHQVPGVVFSTGGYTGNVYHEFNDGIIPLYLSVGHLHGEVVLLILEYHTWWMTKYKEIIEKLTHYKVVDLSADPRTHCFHELAVGLHIHDELTIRPPNPVQPPPPNHPLALSPHPSLSMQDFRDNVLHAAYLPKRESSLSKALLRASAPPSRTRTTPQSTTPSSSTRPKLVIISRKSPRALLNEKNIVKLATRLGFAVSVVAPKSSTEMADLYWDLNTCDVMLGVHGAAMTHLLFMRPGSVFIQVVPIGTEWAADTYYGEPARKFGLHYVEYKVQPRESSLWHKYGPHNPVLSDPESVNKKGWWETKRVYLEDQDVTISLRSIRPILHRALTRRRATSHA